MVTKFDLHDTLMISNGILIVFHSYCCSKIIFILSTILIAKKLCTSKNYLHYLCILPLLFINNEWITIMGYSKHELSTISMLYSRKIIYLSYYTSTFPACKESTVRQPGASGFCYRAGEFCF